MLLGRGPDQDMESEDPAAGYTVTPPSLIEFFQRLADGTGLYDPTNGTISEGDIVRTHDRFLTHGVLQ